MQYTETLEQLVGAVQMVAPGRDPVAITKFLNYRQRAIINSRPYWSGLVVRQVLNIPNQYSTGTITLTQGQNQVVGVGTNWPTNDLINTVLTVNINAPGYLRVTPASIIGINENSLLLIDPLGPNPEVVPVLEVTGTTFSARFQFVHGAGSLIWQSSLAYQQLRAGYQVPWYTMTGFTSSTTALLDNAWAGPTLNSIPYSFVAAYQIFAPRLKDIFSVVDPQTGEALVLHYPIQQLNFDDPQRTSVDWPQFVADYYPNLNGNMQYEFWPSPNSQRQFYWVGYLEWPDMKSSADRPIPFVDPSILVYGATADVMRMRTGPNDMYYDLAAADVYEQKYMAALLNAMQADNGKMQQAYTWDNRAGGYPGGANYAQSHDFDVFFQRY